MRSGLYTHRAKPFRHHVHKSLRGRLRIFLVLGALMMIVVGFDIIRESLSALAAAASIALGAVVGIFSSRIFKLSWDRDGRQVVGQIDAIGWAILAAYVVFEFVRASLVSEWMPQESTAITFAFIAAAFLSRVASLRGRMIRILKDERIFD